MPVTLTSRIPEIAVSLPQRMGQVLEAGADLIAADAKQRVRVGAPEVHVRDAIHTERRGVATWAVVGGDTEAWYGHFLEFGTSHSAPRPFLVPALEAQQAQVTDLAQAALAGL